MFSRRRFIFLSATIGLGLGFTLMPACRASGPPAGAPKVNAVFDEKAELLYSGRPEAGGLPETGDTRLYARCREYREFAQRKRNKNWIEYWAVASFDVVEVQRGAWPHDSLSFLTMSMWPTPASGIMLRHEVMLYRPGVEFRFELRTDENPARIVGQALLTPMGSENAGTKESEQVGTDGS